MLDAHLAFARSRRGGSPSLARSRASAWSSCRRSSSSRVDREFCSTSRLSVRDADEPAEVQSLLRRKSGRSHRRRAAVASGLPIPDAAELVLFGGKGAGKTSAATAAAIALAERRPRDRILVLSTDPAHSLGDAFATPLSDTEQPVPGAPPICRARARRGELKESAPSFCHAGTRIRSRSKSVAQLVRAGWSSSSGSSTTSHPEDGGAVPRSRRSSALRSGALRAWRKTVRELAARFLACLSRN